MSIITRASRHLESVRPLRNAERVQQYRDRHPVTDHDRMERDSKIAAGVRWQKEFIARPIPKHRALVPINH